MAKTIIDRKTRRIGKFIYAICSELPRKLAHYVEGNLSRTIPNTAAHLLSRLEKF